MLDSLYEGGGQAAGVVTELPPAGWAVQDSSPAGPADNVTCRAAGDGEVPGDDETHRALHHPLQVWRFGTTLTCMMYVSCIQVTV